MSDIVADAKAWLSERDNGTLRTHSENCHQWHTECLVARLVAEVERHRMTPEERGVLNEVAAAEESWGRPSSVAKEIRSFLDRTAPTAAS